MKKIFFICILLLYGLASDAKHIAGGELFYQYLGPGSSANTSSFKITLRLFRDCNSTGPLLQDEQVTVGVYENNYLIKSVFLPIQGPVTSISLNTSRIACLIGSVSVCYEIGIYSSTIELVNNTVGYTLSRLGCCRVDGISNLIAPSRNVGSNYTTQIPGLALLNGKGNSSPQFNLKDTALVCARNRFSLDFGATDPDGDGLVYSFCDGFTAPNSSNNIPPPPTLSLTTLPYGSGFSGTNPLGTNVKINPQTGVISGIAPDPGQYVVSVCIAEMRNGIVISTHRKDFILKVQSCDLIAATMAQDIVNCKDYTIYFENQSTSPAIQSYLWSFGDPSNSTSTAPTVTFTYKDTGTYTARLQVTGPNGCTGADSAQVRIYPGFFPAFGVNGSCFLNPYQFKDSTKASYGAVNNWLWNFGDRTTTKDTSTLQNPIYKYSAAFNATVTLIVGSSKGCVDTLQKVIKIPDKPFIDLPFRDTLICSIDSLPLLVNSQGVITWSPNTNIINPNTANPIVFPKDTTTYYVTVNNNGCVNNDSVKVNVLNYITVTVGRDTTICKTDSIQLVPVSHALSYKWFPATGLSNSAVKYPRAAPLANTRYTVQANLGKCQATDSVFIKVIPYPQAFAGNDTIICFGSKAQLNGSIVGSSFKWSPSNILISPNTLHPLAAPSKSMPFILMVYDTLGCPKPGIDSVWVAVIPPIVINAGRDTIVVENQPLQLNAIVSNADNISYRWVPPTGLNNAGIENPIATLSGIDSITYTVMATNAIGCSGYNSIKVKIFKGAPEIYVPSAFTPNKDGLNDIIKPIPVGIKQLQYFNIYNRWGQMIFSTSEIGKGWDGLLNGIKQPPGTYVYLTEGIDYAGKPLLRKGTFVLID